MALKAELQELIASARFSDDARRKALIEILEQEEEAAEDLNSGTMKAKDYTVKTQALADARKQLEQQQQEFEEGRNYLDGQMSTYKADMEKRLNDALAQVSASTLRGAALETKLRTLAAQYGEDPAELLKDVQASREEAKKPEKPEFDFDSIKDRVVGRDEYNQTRDAVFGFAPMIRDFERDYARTFGKEYEGSITELIRESAQEVQALQQRGVKNVDLFGHIRTKFDFAGQQQRNAEAAKAAEIEERKKWETQTREEIERDVRSKVLAENPAAYSKLEWQKPDEWRNKLGAAERKNQLPQRTPQDEFKRRQELHAEFEKNATKSNAA
jgi:hypothetical protein